MLQKQIDLERNMVGLGAERARRVMLDAEADGDAARNPYASHVFSTYVAPLRLYIQESMRVKTPGVRQAHVRMLKGLDPWAVAYIAVRTALCAALGASVCEVRRLGYGIGRNINAEMYLSAFNNISPDLYYIINNDLDRRKSKSTRHRLNVFKAQARSAGLVIPEWDVGTKDQVGLWLLDAMIGLGFLERDIPAQGPGKRYGMQVHLSEFSIKDIENIKGFFMEARPAHGPCVIPPRDWTALNNGGFYTEAMQRAYPFCVKAPDTCREALHGDNLLPLMSTINSLQKTAWRVNKEVLDIVHKASDIVNVGEILTRDNLTKPEPPVWLSAKGKEDELSNEELEEFIHWKSRMSAWYTKRKILGSKFRLFTSSLATAMDYAKYDRFYFVWFADSRGRLYPIASGISPQGSDLQRGMLEFADGEPLDSDDAVKWFCIHGANKFGFDKAPLNVRKQWALDNEKLILDIANNPLDNLEWSTCDNPVQFLSWCLEFKAWRDDPDNFVSRIPVSLDGSCNGLQHFSAMLRDSVGGVATNLTNTTNMQDIYALVAKATEERMRSADSADDAALRKVWLENGITRDMVKRTVMTTPYGVTDRTSVKYVFEETLITGKVVGFDTKDYYKASICLVNYMWPAIGDVVVAARKGMAWLTRACSEILSRKDAPDMIQWVTPSGFLATQAHFKRSSRRVKTHLYGHVRLKVVSEKDDSSPAIKDNMRALAPNFIHSMDAAHLSLVVKSICNTYPNISLACIHDDYGTHARYAQDLYRITREQFVLMYENNNVLKQFKDYHNISIKLPSTGDLDITKVLSSEYFFS